MNDIRASEELRAVTDDEAAVEAALRGYFEASRRGEFPSTYASCELRRFHRLLEGPSPARSRRVLTIESLRVISVEGDRATVDFEASATAGEAPFEVRRRLTGPVELVREDGRWGVSSFVRDGRRSRPIILQSPPSAEQGGVRVSLRALELRVATTVFVVEIANGSGDPVVLERARARASSLRWAREVRIGWPALAAGDRRCLLPVTGPLPADTRTIHVRLDLRSGPRVLTLRLRTTLSCADVSGCG